MAKRVMASARRRRAHATRREQAQQPRAAPVPLAADERDASAVAEFTVSFARLKICRRFDAPGRSDAAPAGNEGLRHAVTVSSSGDAAFIDIR